MAKWLSIILGFLLIGTNGWWFHGIIEQSITLSYREHLIYEYANRIVALSKLSSHLLRGRSEQEVRVLVNEVFPGEEPFKKEGKLNTTWLSFELDGQSNIVGIENDQLIVDWSKPDAP